VIGAAFPHIAARASFPGDRNFDKESPRIFLNNVYHIVRSLLIPFIEFFEVLENEYKAFIARNHIGKAFIKSI